MMTTLNAIREQQPCPDGWAKLLRYLGKTQPDDEPLSIIEILDSNGIDDALWCLRAVEGYDRELRLYSVWCARQVQHLMDDPRSLTALDVAERYANGLATDEELAAAFQAAPGSSNPAYAARCAAWDRNWIAAPETARAAARAKAKAADVAAGAAGEDAGAAWYDAWDAAWDAQADRLREVCAEIDEATTTQEMTK
jgi:hypothetical protein